MKIGIPWRIGRFLEAILGNRDVALDRRGFLRLTASTAATAALVFLGRRVDRGYAALPEDADQAMAGVGMVEQSAQGVGPLDVRVTSLPATIKVLISGSSTVLTLDFEDYLRGVVPCEMPSGWPAAALQAQAVAARCYAARAVASPRHGSEADICNAAHCQVWSQASHTAETDQAVASTRGVAMTYSGSIVAAFFFARCNGVTTRNSEDALNTYSLPGQCSPAGWNPVAYCRARPCTGHAAYDKNNCGFYGHGVGMCQNGAKAKAEKEGKDYRTILTDYYTGIGFLGVPTLVFPSPGALALAGVQPAFVWQTSAQDSLMELWRGGTMEANSGWRPNPSWQVPQSLPAGLYTWRVKERANGVESSYSESRQLILSDSILNTYLPVADNKGTH